MYNIAVSFYLVLEFYWLITKSIAHKHTTRTNEPVTLLYPEKGAVMFTVTSVFDVITDEEHIVGSKVPEELESCPRTCKVQLVKVPSSPVTLSVTLSVQYP